MFWPPGTTGTSLPSALWAIKESRGIIFRGRWGKRRRRMEQLLSIFQARKWKIFYHYWTLCTTSHHVEIILCDSTVFQVKDALEGAVGEQVHLLQVRPSQGHRAELFPHPRGQMQVQRFLGADGHRHEDAQEAKLDHVILRECSWVQQKPENNERGKDRFYKIWCYTFRIMFGDQKMTTKCAPVSVTAHICKAVGSMNQKIHHTRLQLLAKDFFFNLQKGIQENREYFIEHPRQLYFCLLCS